MELAKLCLMLLWLGIIQLSLLYIISSTFKSKVATTIQTIFPYHSYQKKTYANKELQKLTVEINNMTNSNPIYQSFNITSVNIIKRVDILFIITSAPGRINRRNAIRNSWWQECVSHKNITPACYFITDNVRNTSKYYEPLAREADVRKDILFQPLSGGVQFGYRFLYHLLYAYKKFHFDYFVRLDDDIFFCMFDFLHQLPIKPTSLAHWGWVHCKYGVTRPEESTILFSYDVVAILLNQNPKNIICHPFADQMIAIWLAELHLGNILRHDSRIHHDPVVKETPGLQGRKFVCRDYIAIHGSSSLDILNFWKEKGKSNINTKGIKQDIFQSSSKCQSKFNFDWSNLGYWKYKPLKCIDKPTWNTHRHITKNGMYIGRLGKAPR